MSEPYSSSRHSIERVAPSVLDGTEPVLSIIESGKDGQIWAGTNGGLLAFDKDNFEFSGKVEVPETSRVTRLWDDGSSLLWTLTTDSGVYFIDTTPTLFDNGQSGRAELPSGFGGVLSVYEDKKGTVWAGSLTTPVAYNNKGSDRWVSLKEQADYRYPAIPSAFAIAEDNAGNIYFSSNGVGVLRQNISTGEYTRLLQTNSDAIPDNRAMRLSSDSFGNVWVGTMKGFGVLKAGGGGVTLSEEGDVMSFCEKNGRMYAATLNDGIYSVDIRSVLDGRPDIENSKITEDDGFQPIILSMAASPTSDVIYVGTEDEGLWTYDIDKGEYKLTDFVPRHCNLQVAYIAEDVYGSLWIATNRGLYRINLDNTGNKVIYTEDDGLDSDYFCYNGFATDSTLYLPTNKGLQVIDIASTYTDTLSDRDVRFGFTDMLINNRRYGDLSESEKRSIVSEGVLPVYSSQIALPSSFNNVSIEFESYDYGGSARRHTFSYKLDGYDNDWQSLADGRRFATYTNLPFGSYKFRLRVDSENGHRSEEKTIDIKILPPWYLSWPALLAYLILAIVVVLMAIWFVRRREMEKSRIRAMRQEKANIEEQNRTKLRFFTNVTHELLTPLTVISASISELRSGNGDSASLFRIADVNVSKLVRLLQQILEFRKVETDNIRLRVNYGDVGRFISGTVEALRPLTLKKSMKLELRMPPERIMGYFDSDKLDKILYNLVSNAAKYSVDNGIVSVEVESCDGSIVIKVADNGSGIPKEKQADLFKRFYDGDYREHNTSGTGIGLSLTKDLVELHHGTIEVQSVEGEGTCFIVTLPIAEDAFSEDEMSRPKVDPDSQAQYVAALEAETDMNSSEGQDKRKILVIEDNEDLLRLIKQVLERNYEVIAVSDGREGLAIALREIPDLVLTDLTMPGIDGLEIIRRLRDDEHTSLVPIVVLTARRQNEDRKECYEAGADVYLPKPFDPDMLRACVATQLNRRMLNEADMDDKLVIDLKKFDYQSADVQFIKLATEAVERNMDNTEFDIPTFAKEVGISQTHLFRKLKELTDMSPSHFIRTIRLRAAARLLEEHPDIRISELAFMVGFSDSRYFGICFKKEFGVTPVEYKSKS
ncbi:MAG: response regulator [Muribaculum sp.]|nr:response regulator [Muribaculum sp.]